MLSEHMENSNSAIRSNYRVASSSSSSGRPLGPIINRVASGAASDDTMNRSSHVVRKPSRLGVTTASDGANSQESDEYRPRIGPRSSIGGARRSISGAKGGPSVLRRLPPGITPRSAVPSINGTGDESMRVTSISSAAGSNRPAIAALVKVNQASAGPRRSFGATINAAATGGIAQHDRETREVIKLNVNSSNFEEWMKMATDNKINATNTWNFALIDYFHDMSLLRSDNGDGSINFQKASCTLDGCVKVWTSRVDSVVVETGKLLSGLQDEGKEASNKRSRGGGGENDDEEGGEEEDENGTVIKKKRSRAREPTLAKSFAQLAVKKLDLEFTVDPLFKKTSADFDEGGAGGLLMNHLGVDSNARVVFDAGDVAGVGDDQEDQVHPNVEGEDVDMSEDEQNGELFADQVDLLKLRNKLFSQFQGIEWNEEDALGSMLSDMVICPTFSSFKFAPGDDTPFSALLADNADAVAQQQGELLPSLQEYEDEFRFENGAAYEEDGQDDGFGAMDPFEGAPIDGYNGEEYDDDLAGGIKDAALMPSSGPIDFTTAFQGVTDEQGLNLNSDGFFELFDQRLTKNWAGPEHWKMRNLGMGAPALQQSKGDTSTSTGGAEKTSRKSKEPFVIDFCTEEGAVSSKKMFETAKIPSSIMLPQQKDSSSLETYLLPEDRHYNSRQLLRLFIKPRAMLNLKRKGLQAIQNGSHQTDIDEEYWARAAAERETNEGLQVETEFVDVDNGGMPFDTPFFNDGEDDGGFDEALEAVMDIDVNAEDEELATQALKRIRPEFVNYAKKAKRVDVRKLKENIWKELAIVAGTTEEENSGGEQEGEEEGEALVEADKSGTPRARSRATPRASDALQPKVFQSVLAGLRKMYPKDRMDEISTSFCFICLLHLANEEGLQITTSETKGLDMVNGLAKLGNVIEADEDDDALGEESNEEEGEAREEEKVSFLERLSIAKDPKAGRSA